MPSNFEAAREKVAKFKYMPGYTLFQLSVKPPSGSAVHARSFRIIWTLEELGM